MTGQATTTHDDPARPPSPLPRLRLTPRRSALLAGHDNTLDVLVRIEAPDAPVEVHSRPPLNVALVIDRSGSMSGEPLRQARRCAEFALDALQPRDRFSFVVYDDTVHTVVSAVEIGTARDAIREAIRRVDSGGSTDLHGGWLQGAQALVPHAGRENVSRVILLSDGCANAGLCDPAQIFAQCRQYAEAGIGTSTYGLGHGFNEDLMIGMARAGQGRSYYGQSAEDLIDPFREEFELLAALCARRIHLEVGAPFAGVKARVLNEYVVAGDGTWSLPDLAYGGEAWAVLRLKVPASLVDAGSDESAVPLVSIGVRYAGADGEPRAIQPVTLALPVLSAPGFAAVAEDEQVVRRVGELEAAELQHKARAAAMRGEWDTVQSLLRRAERLGTENPWIAAAVGELRTLAARRDEAAFAKQSAYGALRMSTRLAARAESADFSGPAGPSYVRRKANPGKGEDTPPPRP